MEVYTTYVDIGYRAVYRATFLVLKGARGPNIILGSNIFRLWSKRNGKTRYGVIVSGT